MSKNKKKGFLTGIITSIIVFLCYNFLPADIFNNTNHPNPSLAADEAYVIKVIDGDTLKVSIGGSENERVRMLGIDTPESVHPDANKNTKNGKIASNYTKSKLEGKTVKLEFDKEKRDKYGRLLAYVYLDNKMFNEVLLEEGYASVLIISPNNRYEKEFRNIEKEAKAKKIGFWSNK